MSVQKDGAGKRWVIAQVEVPGALDQVWEAIATGPGVSSWFVPTQVREDGTIVSHFGPGMDAVARIIAWEPPLRFVAQGEIGQNAPVMETEWKVEPQVAGTCIVRVVHSLMTNKTDWDHQLESIEFGWPAFFEILRLYLAYYPGQPSALMPLMGASMESAPKAWEALVKQLGFAGWSVGNLVQSSGDAPRLAGLVESGKVDNENWSMLVALNEPTHGLAHLFALPLNGMVLLSLRIYLYGEQAVAIAQAQEPIWLAWLENHFPFPKEPV